MIKILRICVFVTMWCLAHQLSSRQCRMYEAFSGNGLLPDWHQAISPVPEPNQCWLSDSAVVMVRYQCMTLNIFKDCHSGYSYFTIYSPIKFCCGHIFQLYKKLRSFNSHLGYKISRSHSPEEFFIALAIGLLLKSNTAVLCVSWIVQQMKICLNWI